MAELDTITIKGFKSITSIEKLKLEAINVIVGPNGSGKSNFIGVFSFLHAIRTGSLQKYVIKAGGADKVLYFGSKVTEQLYIHISFQKDLNYYEITLVPTNVDELVPSSEKVYFWDKRWHTKPHVTAVPNFGKEAGISNPSFSTRITNHVKERLDRWRLYHFHDTSVNSPMKKTADINDNHYLRPDGSNIAPFLYFLRQSHVDSYNLITRITQRVAPFFDKFQLEPQKLNPDKIRLEWHHKENDAYFDSSSLSDGTLRFIALATLFLQPEEFLPSVILVDEPELGLHPYAITLLASLVKQAAKKTQVIISTQSSLLLDNFQPEDVLVAENIKGGTQITRLDSVKLSEWLKDYSLGQLWEKNEIGGRPRGSVQ